MCRGGGCPSVLDNGVGTVEGRGLVGRVGLWHGREVSLGDVQVVLVIRDTK